MKFGKIIEKEAIPEWKLHYMNYRLLKKTIKAVSRNETSSSNFYNLLEKEQEKIKIFYARKENWCYNFVEKLQRKVVDFIITTNISLEVSKQSAQNERLSTPHLSHECRLSHYISTKKGLTGFLCELDLFLNYVLTQQMGLRKILKKYIKKTGGVAEDNIYNEMKNNPINGLLTCARIESLRNMTLAMIAEMECSKPKLRSGWYDRKVFTVGCFDIFHRGHANLLKSLREFGSYVVVGIHDDSSYFKLKKKYTIDDVVKRMQNVKQYVDQVFIIPSTDPTLFLKAMVSDQDLKDEKCCFVRGEDMRDFPGREFVDSVMPVYLVPRWGGVSSTSLRAIYHSESSAASVDALADTVETQKRRLSLCDGSNV